MSEGHLANTASNPLFDDRIDSETRIGFRAVVSILVRSMGLLRSEIGLFAAKVVLSVMSIVPTLYITWLSRILVDQVLLQQPFGETEVRMPPHVQPFVDLVEGYSPLEIMVALVLFFMFLLFIWGYGRGTWQQVAQGEDSATQSENALSQGESESGGIVGFIDTLIHIRLSQRLTNDLRTRVFDRMSRLPMTTLDDHRIGDAIYRVMYDAPMLPGICYQLTLAPLIMLMGAVIQLWFMYYSYGAVAPQLVWLAASLIPIGLAVTVPFSAIVRRVQQDSRAAGAATTNAMEESLGNISAVQSLGGMNRERDRFESQSKESFRRFRHIKIISIIVELSTFIVLITLAFGVAIWITNDIIEGTLSPGDWSVLFGIWMSLGGTAMALGRFWIDVQGNAAAVRRVFFFMDLKSEEVGVGELTDFVDAIEMVGVSATYPDGKKALENIDLAFKKGEWVAVAGPTGAGKTTLAYIIPAFLEPETGKVSIDGVDTRHLNVESVRKQVAYVFQEHQLLSESIRSNLLLVRPEASEDELNRVLTVAGAMEFVGSLPDGIDTVLGRSGDTLSVGQKQRLSIARGLLRDTPILILDEPTAALDPQTESELIDSLREACKDKLVLIISHRISTIRKTDRIVFLEEGHLRDVGSHDELMAVPDSSYRRFVELQTRVSA